jgi:hypothetical protein
MSTLDYLIGFLVIMILLYLFSGVLYLVLITVKYLLGPSIWFTPLINRRIHQALLITPLILGLGVMIYCALQDPIKSSLEGASDITIPTEYEILSDEYEACWQDYSREFEIRLQKDGIDQVSQSIRKSSYFVKDEAARNDLRELSREELNLVKPHWMKTTVGYSFYRKESLGKYYRISVDTTTFRISYREVKI